MSGGRGPHLDLGKVEQEKGWKRLASGEEHVETSCPEIIPEFCCAVSGSNIFSFFRRLRFNLCYPPLRWEQKL